MYKYRERVGRVRSGKRKQSASVTCETFLTSGKGQRVVDDTRAATEVHQFLFIYYRGLRALPKADFGQKNQSWYRMRNPMAYMHMKKTLPITDGLRSSAIQKPFLTGSATYFYRSTRHGLGLSDINILENEGAAMVKPDV